MNTYDRIMATLDMTGRNSVVANHAVQIHDDLFHGDANWI